MILFGVSTAYVFAVMQLYWSMFLATTGSPPGDVLGAGPESRTFVPSQHAHCNQPIAAKAAGHSKRRSESVW